MAISRRPRKVGSSIQGVAWYMNELIPKVSSYTRNDAFFEVGFGDLQIEQVGPLLQKLGEAWKIAAWFTQGSGYGNSDEADAISLIMSQIRKKYQDRATNEQRSRWA